MNLTFECGTCNSTYKLDTSHITTTGVKITCPKCLTFFFLKDKPALFPEPNIEKVAEKDGSFQINFPTSPKIDVNLELPETVSELHTDPKFDASLETLSFLPSEAPEQTSPLEKETTVENDFDLLSSGSFDELLERKRLASESKPAEDNPETGKMNTTHHTLTSAELADFPEDHPPESKLDSLLIPLSLIGLALSALLFLNYKGIIFIPGLENLRAEKLQTTPVPVETPFPIATPQTKYGFPVIEDSPTTLPTEEKSPTAVPQK